jgi:hypothetical protein
MLAGVSIAGACALLAIVVFGPDEWGAPGTASYRTYELVNRAMGLALTATTLAPVALRLAQGTVPPGGTTRVGLWLATLGSVGLALGSFAEFWVLSDSPYQGAGSLGRLAAWMVFLLSGTLLLAGSMVTGIGLLRRREMPPWAGWAVVLAGPLGIVATLTGASLFICLPLITLAMGAAALVGQRHDRV